MNRSAICQGVLTGYHANSYLVPQKTRPKSKADESTHRLAQQIPFWPEKISYTSLEKITGMSKRTINNRISSCHADYLIFADRGQLSRLKDDLSNCQ